MKVSPASASSSARTRNRPARLPGHGSLEMAFGRAWWTGSAESKSAPCYGLGSDPVEVHCLGLVKVGSDHIEAGTMKLEPGTMKWSA